MINISQNSTELQIVQGIREAMNDYLRIQEGARIDLQPMAFLYSAIKSATKLWLDDNRDVIIDAIAKHATGEDRSLPYRPRVERKRAPRTAHRAPNGKVAARKRSCEEIKNDS